MNVVSGSDFKVPFHRGGKPVLRETLQIEGTRQHVKKRENGRRRRDRSSINFLEPGGPGTSFSARHHQERRVPFVSLQLSLSLSLLTDIANIIHAGIFFLYDSTYFSLSFFSTYRIDEILRTSSCPLIRAISRYFFSFSQKGEKKRSGIDRSRKSCRSNPALDRDLSRLVRGGLMLSMTGVRANNNIRLTRCRLPSL